MALGRGYFKDMYKRLSVEELEGKLKEIESPENISFVEELEEKNKKIGVDDNSPLQDHKEERMAIKELIESKKNNTYGKYKMSIKIIDDIAIVNSDEIIIKDTGSIGYFVILMRDETGCDKIVLNKNAITEEFFVPSKGVTKEILFLFTRLQKKLAIIGDYSEDVIQQLKEFVSENNYEEDIFFVATEEEAIEMLNKV